MIKDKKICIVIPAYNNSATLSSVLERVPASISTHIDNFIIVNDGSSDGTQEVIDSLARGNNGIISIRHGKNIGYAQAQKTGFNLALEIGADIIVLLHADGQYAPEELPKLLQPFLDNQADIVQGSRILGGKALEGGMPLYKYLAIRFASIIENFVYGMNLCEYHSGYMLYSRRALERIPFKKLSRSMYFDGEMLFMGHLKGLRIKHLPISTAYYKGQKSGVKPLNYVFEVSGIIIKKICGGYSRL